MQVCIFALAAAAAAHGQREAVNAVAVGEGTGGLAAGQQLEVLE
jgi:hypothetical protein